MANERLRSAIWLPPQGDGPPRLRPAAVYPVLFLVVLALGVNWPVMSVALRSVSALWLAVFRLAAAGITVLVLTLATGRLAHPPRADRPVILTVGLLRLALVFVLVFLGLEIVPPGRSSILVWTASLWTVPVAAMFLGERMNRGRWIGLLVGIAGIVAVFEPTRLDWTDGRVLLGHGFLLGAAITHAVVGVHVRGHGFATTPFSLLPWQVGVAILPVLAVALVREGIPSIDWSLGLVLNVFFQGTVVSGFATWGQMTVLRSLPAISTSLALMAVPVVGLFSAAIAVGEQLTAAVVAGLVLVLAGVVIASRARDPADDRA